MLLEKVKWIQKEGDAEYVPVLWRALDKFKTDVID